VSEENARPQDVGRSHHRSATTPAPETVRVLDRYRAAMRGELDDVLGELRPGGEQLGFDGMAAPLRPALAERLKLWDLAIKLGRELAAPSAGGDPSDAEAAPDEPIRPSARGQSTRSKAPRLTARERRALGG
jgi:hypothetical protein